MSVAVLATLLATSTLPATAQAPMVSEEAIVRVAPNVHVIPDGRVNLVPNVGIVVGDRGIMVVDTGMGPANAERVLKQVRRISDKTVLYLTVTHFHPEHGMGAQAFPPETTIIYPAAQRDELMRKGQSFIQLFSGFSPEIAGLLKPVRIVGPHVTFTTTAEVDLGGTAVRLLHFGAAHTLGDNFVFLPKERILFGGDVVLNRFFPILPDPDASGSQWITILDHLARLAPATVIPGHGEVGDSSLILAMKQHLVAVRGRVRELAGQGRNRDEIAQTVSAEFGQTYQDWQNPHWLKNEAEHFHGELTK
jgi:glyoxylase-like metal-dependent hydrolase (beta-lactamase superfamily II)